MGHWNELLVYEWMNARFTSLLIGIIVIVIIFGSHSFSCFCLWIKECTWRGL